MAEQNIFSRILTNALALYVMIFYLAILMAGVFGLFQLFTWPFKTLEIWPSWGIYLFAPIGVGTLVIGVKLFNVRTIKKHLLNFQ